MISVYLNLNKKFRLKVHKHSVIGKHLKDEHNVRPSNLRENFTILKKCRSKPNLNTQGDSIRVKLFV